MASRAIRKDESLALILALVAHGLLFAWLAMQRPAPAPPPPERMTVTLSEDLAAISTSPEPMADPAPDLGPVLGETPPEPEPVATPEPRPSPKAQAKAPAPKPTPPPKQAPKQPAKQSAKKGGASEFDSAFSPGTPGGAGKQQTKNAPAAAPSDALKSSWKSYIGSKVEKPWQTCAPTGLDAEKLRVNVRFTLDRFGEVATMQDPMVTGITDSNRPQVEAYKRCAMRAIRVSAPFDDLPLQFYDYWKARNLTFRKEW
jgi:outer membrane biosynthesis protein TonB